MRPEAWRSRRILTGLRNSREGEAAVIICNGPSLNKVDLTLLDGFYTMGLNKINLLFDRSSFRPSCILSVDWMIIWQNLDFYNSTDIPLFIDHRFHSRVRSRPNVTFLHATRIPQLAHDCTVSLNYGPTVTVVALQMALHLGFSDVCIVGCDHYVALPGKPSSTHTSVGTEQNHFDPRYFSAGQKTNLPNYPEMDHHYQLARDAFESEGRSIMNCTAGGRLEIFERMDLAAWVTLQKQKRGRA